MNQVGVQRLDRDAAERVLVELGEADELEPDAALRRGVARTPRGACLVRGEHDDVRPVLLDEHPDRVDVLVVDDGDDVEGRVVVGRARPLRVRAPSSAPITRTRRRPARLRWTTASQAHEKTKTPIATSSRWLVDRCSSTKRSGLRTRCRP